MSVHFPEADGRDAGEETFQITAGIRAKKGAVKRQQLVQYTL